MTATPAAPAPRAGQASTLHLSELLRRPVTDRGGESIGRLSDVIVRLRGADMPLVTGLVAAVGGRELYVPIEQVAWLGSDEVKLTSAKLDLRQFERREGEVLLRADVLGHRLIDVESAQLIRAADLELERRGEDRVVAGVDTHRQSRWLLRSRQAEPSEHSFREWTKFEPLIGHTGSALLRGPFARIRRLKPAQIADLIENASKEEETEILGQVHADPELEADVFEELDTEHQVEFLRSRSDAEAARVLASMAPDDAADLIMEIEQERRLAVLEMLPEPQRRKVRLLLSYNPETAGGLMSPDFLGVRETSTVAAVLDAVRHSTAPPEVLGVAFAIDEQGRATGSASVVKLLRTDPDAMLRSVAEPIPTHIHPDWDLGATVRTMSDFNLTVAPVMDPEHERLIGVVTADDVLELLLPTGWRRDFGATAPEE